MVKSLVDAVAPARVVLVDLENVLAHPLDFLRERDVRLLIFVGPHQNKLPFDFVASVQSLGSRAEYVKVSGAGPNALDFHIAFYLGTLSAANPAARFSIISRDAGFDPLIQHLRGKNIVVERVQAIADLAIDQAAAASREDHVERVVERLSRNTLFRPRSLKTLRRSIAAQFKNQLGDEEIERVVDRLLERGFISLGNGKVDYATPRPAKDAATRGGGSLFSAEASPAEDASAEAGAT